MRYFLSLLLCLKSGTLFSQVVALENSRENIVYMCLPNYFTVAVSNCPPQQIVLKTDNGRVQKDHESGHYLYYPEKVGPAKIFIRKIVKGKSIPISERFLRVRRMHINASFGHLQGNISKVEAYSTHALSANVVDLSIDAHFEITNFNVVVIRRAASVYSRHIAGHSVDDETTNFFATLENGDNIIFEKISIVDCDMSVRELDPLKFSITNAESFTKSKPHIEWRVDPITGDSVGTQVK